MALLKPKEIAKVFSDSAYEKNGHSTGRLFLLSIIGGAFIALGFMLAIQIAGGSPSLDPGMKSFILGCTFPVGFIMCMIGGGEIFTSACAAMPIPFFRKQTSFLPVLRVWGLVYAGNIVGGVLVAWFFTKEIGFFHGAALTYMFHIAEHKVGTLPSQANEAHLWVTFVKAVGANWMVCMAAWMAYSAKDTFSKIFCIWLPVMTFVTFGFEHCVANMYIIPAAIFCGAPITWGQFIGNNLIVATLGNIVGGFVFVGLAYWYIYLKNVDQNENKSDSVVTETGELLNK
ncbi:formate/nitrite transporter family protein [Persicobacter psychrovividus]|uniref:Formate/nitrite transporter n=1 Tax=Persicobacter psychrovividus TaxID=387638 RepID=A0ABN6LBA9_9BACT|nr:formate/nitrite transporter [Persicobacter psychrovividus]